MKNSTRGWLWLLGTSIAVGATIAIIKSSDNKNEEYISGVKKIDPFNKVKIAIDNFQSNELIIESLSYTHVKKFNNKTGWKFNWQTEPKNHLYFSISDSSGIICLFSLSIEEQHIELQLMEKKSTSDKKLMIQPVVAFTSYLSHLFGFEGDMAFYAKGELVEYYMKATPAYVWSVVNLKPRLIIIGNTAEKLLSLFYKSETL